MPLGTQSSAREGRSGGRIPSQKTYQLPESARTLEGGHAGDRCVAFT